MRSVNELGENELNSYIIVMRAMPNLVGTSSRLIVLLMVQTSNLTIAKNTVRDVMLKEINNNK